MKKYSIIILISSLILIALGVIMVLSASNGYSNFRFDNLFKLFTSHISRVVLGLLCLIAFSIFPYEKLKGLAKPALLGITVILVLTRLFAPSVKGAGRWINLGIINFQPADAAKIILFIFIAALIEKKGEEIKDLKNGFNKVFMWIVIISGLILIQPNISNGVLLLFIGLTVLYLGGARFKHIGVAAMGCLVTGAIAALAYPHSQARILGYINGVNAGKDINIQVKQALLGLGSGGFLGLGFGNSLQSQLYLPESYGDFIFSVLGEEVGFLGAIIVLLIYLVIFLSGIIIAKNTKDKFGQLLAFAISFSIIVYAFVNVAVTTGLFPTTGLPLPFISYGGTSILFLCVSVGILINIGLKKEDKIEEPENLKVNAA